MIRRAMVVVCAAALLCGCDEETVPPDSGAADLAPPADAAPDAAPKPDLVKKPDRAKKPDAASPDKSKPKPDAGIGPCATVPISTRQALLKAIQALKWSAYSPNTAGFLPLSQPLAVKGTITLTHKDLSPPPGCTKALVCFQKVLFSGGVSAGKPSSGVTFSAKSTEVPLTAYESITITNATVRLRPVVENIHPFTYNFAPILRVEPDCNLPCASNTQACPKDKLCYASNTYCRVCLAQGHKQCACHKFGASRADGAKCSYLAKTMSALCHGTCKAGTCVYPGKPDVYCP